MKRLVSFEFIDAIEQAGARPSLIVELRKQHIPFNEINYMNLAIYAINGLLVGAMLALVGLGKITWAEALVGIGFVLTPSAAHAALNGKQ